MNVLHLVSVIIALVVSCNMTGSALASQDENATYQMTVRRDTPSGFPVPRFVSLKGRETYCRIGPTFNHRVEYTFQRRGLPVMVVAESHDHWRKIRDFQGDECWIHRSKLSGTKTVLVGRSGVVLRAHGRIDALQKAQLGEGVLAVLLKKSGEWCKIRMDEQSGWTKCADLWGTGLSHQ